MSPNFGMKRLATNIYSAVFSGLKSDSLVTAFTSCNVCQRLEAPWPILIYDLHEPANGRFSCAGCELLYTVFGRTYASNFPGKLHGKVDFREGKIYVTLCNYLSYAVYVGRGEKCPLPSIPQGLAKFGSEDPEVAAMVIKRWLDVCDNLHSKCGAVSGGLNHVLPTRIIAIQGPKQVFLRTVNTNSGGLQYACLSHCWGGIVPLRTTSETIQTFQDTGIAWETLPRSFRDAIDLTERLGLRYIWIDSLCIIQDDIEDWRGEGSRMGGIFSGAYVTLAAASATGSDKGLYQARSVRLEQETHSIPNQENVESPYDIHTVETGQPSMEWQDLPLFTRAWAFQEIRLTPRIIHFAQDMLHWECVECKAQENESNWSLSACSSHPKPRFTPFKKVLNSSIKQKLKRPFEKALKNSVRETSTGALQGTSSSHPPAVLEACKARFDWYEIVVEYTRTNLTFSKDKLPALQGVAKHVQSKRGCAYYAGLWEDELCMELIWWLEKPNTLQITYRAPSWSWASKEGYVNYFFEPYMKAQASVIHVEIVPAGKDPLGEVIAGTLGIKGLCLPAVVKLEEAKGKRKAHNALSVIGNNGPVKMQWHQDHENSNLEDQNLTAVLVASDNWLFQAYYLVLLPTKKDERVYQRVGLAVWKGADNPSLREQFKGFDSIVLEHARRDRGWEGCKEFQEFSII